jgi:hypothetical protein
LAILPALEINLLMKTAALKKASRKSELSIYRPQITTMKRIARNKRTAPQGQKPAF